MIEKGIYRTPQGSHYRVISDNRDGTYKVQWGEQDIKQWGYYVPCNVGEPLMKDWVPLSKDDEIRLYLKNPNSSLWRVSE